MFKQFIEEKTARLAIYILFVVAVFGAFFFAYLARAHPVPIPVAVRPPVASSAPAAASVGLPASGSGTPLPSERQPAADDMPLESLPALQLGEGMPEPGLLEAELARLDTAGYMGILPDIINLEYVGSYYATAYCCEVYPHICGGNGVTASGTVPTPGLTAAADWDVLPPGTWLYIEDVGIRRVEDSGSAIQSARLDIAIDTHANALAWRGLGNHRVWVLAWNNTRLLR